MKLQSQLNAAFTALLLVVMAVAGFIIYQLILDLLIQDEQRQLEEKGELIVNFLNEQRSTPDNVQQFEEFLREQNLQLFLYDRNRDTVLFSTLPPEYVQGLYYNNDFSDESSTRWSFNGEHFVTSRIIILPEQLGVEMILLTPMEDIHAVQQNFLIRLFFIFLIGTAVAIALSYFLTNKLVTPLTQLKRQLKKIEKRQFNDLEQIKASGEIKEVADSVYEMAEELKRYIDTQQTFFQNASHELKTPLMTIQGYAEGIKDGIFDEAEKEKGLEVMVTEVKRLKSIINEMILLAKLESKQDVYHPNKIDGREFLNQVVDRVIPFANDKGISIKKHADRHVTFTADEEKLLRAVLNIVVNGVRHADAVVKITMTEQNGQSAILIEDDGPGIAEELEPNIFHRFVKGKDGETGLGLSIARAIISRADGKITTSRSVLGGAQFTILLPK